MELRNDEFEFKQVTRYGEFQYFSIEYNDNNDEMSSH